MVSCSSSSDSEEQTIVTSNCESNQKIDLSRGICNETLPYVTNFSQNINGLNRVISANAIPNHKVGLFGQSQGSLNPNAISPQNENYNITTTPTIAASLTSLIDNGPSYSFGVLLNGVELDPVAAEPFPHQGIMNANVNWDWNLEAINVRIGLDCNNAHVQPSGKYHYHGSPVLYLNTLNVSSSIMTLIGYAADGFPIYHKYAYSDPDDNNSTVIEMKSSYQLKLGNRSGDGISAPCGSYDGVYTNDYEYKQNLGDLDQANGREGVTPEYPDGTYYYIITDEFPSIPRYFKGTPSQDFKLGR